MNNERSKPDSDYDDRLVSATYRDLANEKPSDTLNKSIFQQASAAAKPKYLRSMSWMHPVAWAATIALCFAIALEVTRVPQPETDAFNSTADPIDMRSKEDREQKDKKVIDSRDDAVMQTTESGLRETKSASGGDTEGDTDAAIGAAGKLPERVEPAVRKRASELLSSPQSASEAPAPSIADEFIIEDSDMMHDAEDIARSQSGNNREHAPAVQARSLSATAYKIEAEQPCDNEATSTPTNWIRCIDELEKAGRRDAADRQREQLKLAFPEFELP